MKPLSTSTFVIFLMLSTVSGNLFSLNYDDALAKKYSEKATLILDASVRVVKKEYQDRDGFKVDDEAVIKHNLLNAEKDMFGGNAVASVQYLVRFTDATVVKGNDEATADLKWSFQNSATASCTHYPRELISGKRYRFFIKRVDDERVVGVNLLEPPGDR